MTYEAIFHEEEPNERSAEWVVVRWEGQNGLKVAGYLGPWGEQKAKEHAARLNAEELEVDN